MIWTPNKDLIFPPQKAPLFRIKKYRDLVIERAFGGSIGLGGFYRIEAMGQDGRCRWLTDWFHNRITDVGLDMCATDIGRYRACQVGTGNATPDDADTTLNSFLAGTSTRTYVSEAGNTSTAPYWYESYYRYDFSTGAVVGNLAEVAIGPSAASGSNVFSRELIRDSGGSPTTISITSADTLRVHHRLRSYAPSGDVTGTLTANLNGVPTDLAYTRRALYAGRAQWKQRSNSVYYGTNAGLIGGGSGYNSSGSVTAYTGAMVGANSSSAPSGVLESTGDRSPSSYSPGSFNLTSTQTIPSGTARNGIKTLAFKVSASFSGNYGSEADPQAYFQVQFDPVFNKGVNDSLTIELLTSWGRYTP